MYATIQRWSGTQNATADALSAVKRLTAELSRRAGFVSFALLEADGQIDVSIVIFETEDELAAANCFIAGWAAEHLPGWRFDPDQATSGEIVVQRGL